MKAREELASGMIVIRQEVIIPGNAKGVRVSQKVVSPSDDSHPETTQSTDSPEVREPGAVERAATAGDSGADVRIIEPFHVPSGCTPSSKIGFTDMRGHSLLNGVGARTVCVNCFAFGHPVDLSHPPAMNETTCISAPSGGTLDPDWIVCDVPIDGTSRKNLIVAWSEFGDNEWFAAIGHFEPCENSGLGVPFAAMSALPGLPQAAESQPARRFVAEILDASASPEGATAELALDDYCSSPEQFLWFGSSPETATQWILKVCRYGDKLLAILTNRRVGSPHRVWICDSFQMSGENILVQEGNPASTARIRAA